MTDDILSLMNAVQRFQAHNRIFYLYPLSAFKINDAGTTFYNWLVGLVDNVSYGVFMLVAQYEHKAYFIAWLRNCAKRFALYDTGCFAEPDTFPNVGLFFCDGFNIMFSREHGKISLFLPYER